MSAGVVLSDGPQALPSPSPHPRERPCNNTISYHRQRHLHHPHRRHAGHLVSKLLPAITQKHFATPEPPSPPPSPPPDMNKCRPQHHVPERLYLSVSHLNYDPPPLQRSYGHTPRTIPITLEQRHQLYSSNEVQGVLYVCMYVCTCTCRSISRLLSSLNTVRSSSLVFKCCEYVVMRSRLRSMSLNIPSSLDVNALPHSVCQEEVTKIEQQRGTKTKNKINKKGHECIVKYPQTTTNSKTTTTIKPVCNKKRTTQKRHVHTSAQPVHEKVRTSSIYHPRGGDYFMYTSIYT